MAATAWLMLSFSSCILGTLEMYGLRIKSAHDTRTEGQNQPRSCNNQKGVLHSGIKIFNQLPKSIKSFSKDQKLFKITLKSFLLENTVYSLDEYYQVTSKETYSTCIT